jgi:hypothetical protein
MARTRFLVGSKLDSAVASRCEELRRAADRRELEWFEVSSVTKQGVNKLLGALERELEKSRSASP